MLNEEVPLVIFNVTFRLIYCYYFGTGGAND